MRDGAPGAAPGRQDRFPAPPPLRDSSNTRDADFTSTKRVSNTRLSTRAPALRPLRCHPCHLQGSVLRTVCATSLRCFGHCHAVKYPCPDDLPTWWIKTRLPYTRLDEAVKNLSCGRLRPNSLHKQGDKRFKLEHQQAESNYNSTHQSQVILLVFGAALSPASAPPYGTKPPMSTSTDLVCQQWQMRRPPLCGRVVLI